MRTVFAVASIALASAAGFAQPQPDETLPGFKATQLYSNFGTDSVNVFSGDPGIVIPLGPEYSLSPGASWQLKAFYSAKFWHLFRGNCQEMSPCGGVQTALRGHVTGYPTLGVGWTLELGYVTGLYNSVTNQFNGIYVSPDGQQHVFTIGGSFGSSVTDDGSQLRITRQPDQTFLVWQPDGTYLTFAHTYLRPIPVNGFDFSNDDRNNGNPRILRYGLTSMTDRFGQSVLGVNYQQPYPSESAWKVSSVVLSGGRIVNFFWGIYSTSDGVWDVLQAVDFPVTAPPATALHVAFGYLPSVNLLRTSWDGGGSQTCVAAGPRNTNLPFLQTITQLEQVQSFEYLLSLDPNVPNGVLNAMTIPTGGRIEYDYSLSTAPPPVKTEIFGNPELTGQSGVFSRHFSPLQATAEYDDCSADAFFQQFVEAAPAVVTRRERVSAGGTILSEVRYFRDQFGSRDLPQDRFVDPERVVRRVVITRPDGNGSRVATKVIFHATPYRSPMEVSRREYGSIDTGAAPLRSVIACYDQQSMILGSGCGVAGSDGRILDFSEAYFDRRSKTVTWFGANPAPAGGDCGDASTPCWQSMKSTYNAIAREHETEKKSSNNQTLLYLMDSRTTTTHWTPNVDASHWLLKLFDRKTVTDDYTAVPCPWQPCSVRTDYAFNPQNGFLNSVQTSDPTWGTLTRSFAPDSAGNPGVETVSGTSGNGSLSGTFVTRRAFANGRVLSSQKDGISWKGFDVTRDGSVGWISTSRDANGQATTYEYDTLGRLTKATPPGGEVASTYCYIEATTGQAAYVLAKKGATSVCSQDDGIPVSGSGSLEAYQFDPFGRLQREARRMPNPISTGSYFSFQEHRYDAGGHRAFVSEWTPCGLANGATDIRSCFSTAAPRGTTWSNYDFLGRPRQVTGADGSVTTHSYDDPAGISNSDFVDLLTQTRSYTDAGGQPVTGPLTSGFRKDVLGRTLLVAEPGPPPYGPITSYQYNALDKLTTVNLAGTSVQQRTFAYDLFGFLRSETHPEKGTTSYPVFNALGSPVASSEPDGLVLTRAYDSGGRLTQIAAGSQKYVVNCYDGATTCVDGSVGFSGGSFPLGKLTRRIAWNPFAPAATRITEDFNQSGLGGRLSDKTTYMSSGSPASVTEHWFYNSLGLTAQYDHPRASGGLPFVVSTTYASGVAVTEYADGIPMVKGIRYLPSGATGTYVTGVGLGHDVTTTITSDLSSIARPGQFSAVEQASGLSLFDTGVYAYDSAGNIVGAGGDVFSYDPLSRLTRASLGAAGTQSYTYDTYGNMLSKGGVTYSVNPASNRVGAPYTYDGRGNVTGTGLFSYTYDALDRQVTHQDNGTVWTYLFAGDNERLVRVLPVSLGQPVYTFRDEARRVAAEYVGATASRDNIFLGQQLVVSFANTLVNGSSEAWHFYSSDHLGTPRIDTGLAGNLLDNRKYWPFGESVAAPQSNQRIRFSGMEVDTEAGNRYYDHARSHDAGLGRFLSPDRVGGTIGIPQGWNRYSYSLNSPLRFVDPDGHQTAASYGSAVALDSALDNLRTAATFLKIEVGVGCCRLDTPLGTIGLGLSARMNLLNGQRVGSAFAVAEAHHELAGVTAEVEKNWSVPDSHVEIKGGMVLGGIDLLGVAGGEGDTHGVVEKGFDLGVSVRLGIAPEHAAEGTSALQNAYYDFRTALLEGLASALQSMANVRTGNPDPLEGYDLIDGPPEQRRRR